MVAGRVLRTSLRPWAFRVGITVIAVVLVVVAVELVGLAYFHSVAGGLFYTRAVPEPEAVKPPPLPRRVAQFAPYAGYARGPGVTVGTYLRNRAAGDEALRRQYDHRLETIPSWVDIPSNNFGFFSRYDYPLQDRDKVTIGVFGGSVAQWFSVQAAERLVAALGLQPDEAVVLNFGHDSYKQPQQIVLLAYFLTRGQHLDFVVNLDGFNEVVLGFQNYRRDVDFSMPYIQYMRQLTLVAQAGFHEAAQSHLSQITRLQVDVARLNERIDVTRSAAIYMFTHLALRRKDAELDRASAAAMNTVTLEDRDRELVRLPPLLTAEETDMDVVEAIAASWVRCSRLMAAMAEGVGAHYVHVLQPNQYYGDRAFSADEAAAVIRKANHYRAGVERGYPVLRERSRELREAGIDYIDGTTLFDEVSERVYADHCCHYNQLGNELVADAVAASIRPHLLRRGR